MLLLIFLINVRCLNRDWRFKTEKFPEKKDHAETFISTQSQNVIYFIAINEFLSHQFD